MISVIIPTLNSEATLAKCLESIYRNKNAPPFEVIVVDGGSTDKTVEIASKYNVKVIFSAKPQSRQRNKGVDYARGDIIAFADSDVTVAENWLSVLSRNLEKIEYVGIGGPHLTPDADPFWAKCFGILLESALGSAGVRNTSVYRNIREVDHNPPSNSALRKKVFQEVGGFDPEFKTAEDVTLDAKIKRKGYRLLYDPAAIVWHPQKTNLKDFLKQLFGYGKGRASAFLKYPESVPLQYFLVVLFVLGTILTLPILFLVEIFRPIIIIGWVAYFMFILVSAGIVAWKKREIVLFPVLPVLAFLEHFTLGLGFISGLLRPYKAAKSL